jgi:RimJ/RimL family protein N-acetyltransferase
MKRPRAEPIGTERLILEPPEVGHAMEMAVVLARPTLHRFTGGRPPASSAELRASYERPSAGSPDGQLDWLNWGLRLRESDALAGTVQATKSHTRHALIAQVEWVVGVACQRQGFASEAARAMVS